MRSRKVGGDPVQLGAFSIATAGTRKSLKNVASSPCFGSNSGRSNSWTKHLTNEPQSVPVYMSPIP